MVLDQTTKIAVTGCPKAKQAAHKRKRGKGKARGKKKSEKKSGRGKR
jgi:hypothetical protein